MALQPGDYGVVRTGGLIGRLIRLLTGTPGHPATVNHAAVCVSPTTMVEMQPAGAVLSPTADYPTMRWYRPPMTATQQATVATAALALVEVDLGYSYIDIVAQFAYRALHVRPRMLARWITSPRRMVCSQAVDWCEAQAGVHLFVDGRLAGLVAPQELADLGDQSGWAVHP